MPRCYTLKHIEVQNTRGESATLAIAGGAVPGHEIRFSRPTGKVNWQDLRELQNRPDISLSDADLAELETDILGAIIVNDWEESK
jgi:hypothetical protein